MIDYDGSCRAVGYATLFCFMLTFHLGGAWSSWATEHAWWIARLLAFTLAPIGVLVAVYSRIRYAVAFRVELSVTDLSGSDALGFLR